jgi:hypothetical protein
VERLTGSLPRDELELETIVQHASDQTQDDAVLVEMGKVSQTQGSFLGAKIVGNGFRDY